MFGADCELHHQMPNFRNLILLLVVYVGLSVFYGTFVVVHCTHTHTHTHTHTERERERDGETDRQTSQHGIHCLHAILA